MDYINSLLYNAHKSNCYIIKFVSTYTIQVYIHILMIESGSYIFFVEISYGLVILSHDFDWVLKSPLSGVALR